MWVLLRLRFLNKAKKGVIIDSAKEVRLHYAFWSYFYQVAGLILSVLIFNLAIGGHARSPVGMIVAAGVSLFALSLTIATFVPRLKACVTIGIGGVVFYQEGQSNRIVYPWQIVKYSCNSYYFFISLNDGKVAKIPATLRRSEIVMAFLDRVVAENKKSA